MMPLEPQVAEDEQTLLEMKYKETPYRYCILLLYSLLAMIVGLSYSGYSAISPQVQQVRIVFSQLYGISVAQSNLISTAYPTMSLFLILPSIYILSYMPVRLNVLIVVLVSILGAWVRCLINVKFRFAVIGQYIFAISFVFMRSIVTRLSALWFKPHHRTFATSIMFAVLFSCDVLSLFVPVLFVSIDQIPKDEEPYYRNQLSRMHIIQAVTTTAIGIFALLFFKEKPLNPVSPTAVIKRTQFWKTLKLLFCDRSFIFLAVFIAITDSMVVAYRIIMRDAFKDNGITSASVAIFSLISAPVTFTAVTFSGYLSGILKHFKTFMVIIGLSIFTLLTLLIPLKDKNSATVFGVFQVLFHALGPPSASLSYEMAAQISFPVPEAFSSSFQNFFLKLLTVIFIQGSSPFIQGKHIKELIVTYCVLQFIACVLILFVKEKHNRRNTDAEIIKQQAPISVH